MTDHTQRFRVACKTHRCYECDNWIHVGERYLAYTASPRHDMNSTGNWLHAAFCVRCAKDAPEVPHPMTRPRMAATVALFVADGADGGIAARLNEVKDVPRRAVVHPGCPTTAGPAICQGCRSLVWWSGALWTNPDETWHRCAG